MLVIFSHIYTSIFYFNLKQLILIFILLYDFQRIFLRSYRIGRQNTCSILQFGVIFYLLFSLHSTEVSKLAFLSKYDEPYLIALLLFSNYGLLMFLQAYLITLCILVHLNETQVGSFYLLKEATENFIARENTSSLPM